MARHNSAVTWKPGVPIPRKWGFVLSLVVLSLLFFAPTTDAASTYWQPIEVNSTAVLADYQALITLDTATLVGAGKMKADGGDIRIFDSNAAPLPFWIEIHTSATTMNTAATKIWVRIPSIPINPPNPRKFIHLLYGDPAATTLSDGTGTFLFFDDFSGGLAKWTIEKQPVANSINTTNAPGYLYCGNGVTGFPFGHTVLGSVNTYNTFTNGVIEGVLWHGTDSIPEIGFRGNYAANTGYKARWDQRAGIGMGLWKRPYEPASWTVFAGPNGIGFPAFTHCNYKVSVSGSNINAWGGATLLSGVDATYAGAGEISLQNHYGAASYYDDVRVRRYATTEPTTLFGTYGATGSISIVEGLWCATTSINLALTATDASGLTSMRFRDDVGTSLTVAYATTQAWTISAAQGTHTVSVSYINGLGFPSASVSASIRLDTLPPTTPALGPVGAYTIGTSFIASCSTATDGLGIGGVNYVFEQATDAGFTTGLASSSWIATSTWTFSGLTHNQLYYYRVRARDALGNTTPFSPTKSSTQDSLPPTATEYTDNVAGNNDLDETFSFDKTLSFAPVGLSDPVSGVGNVRVQIGKNAFATIFTDTMVGAAGNTTQTIATLSEGDMIYARAIYRDNVGNWSVWNASQTTNGILIDLPPSSVTISLEGIFTNAMYTATTTELHASWTPSVDPVSGIDHYEYAIGTASGATDVVAWTNVGGLMDVTPTGLSLVHAQTYWFSVKAVNGRMTPTISNASITVDLQPPLAPPVMNPMPVSGYSPTATRTVGCGAIVDPISFAVQYYFEQCTDGTFTTVTANSGWATAPTFDFGGLSHQTQYWYRVKARDLLFNQTFNHETAFSAPVTTIQDLYPPVASGFIDIISENIDIDPTPGHFGDVYGAFSRDRTISFAPVNMYDDCSGNSNLYVEICRISPTPYPFFSGWGSVPAPTFGTLLWSGTTGGFATFTVTLPAMNDADVVFARVQYIDVAGNWAVVASAQVTDGILIDLPTPAVTVTPDYYINASGTFSATTTQVVTSWNTATDSASGIRNYDLAIGIASGDTTIVPWTDVGLLTATTSTGLALVHSQPYWVSTRVWNGNDTPTVSNANFRIDIVEPPIPVMNPLPMYTPGDSCTVSCTWVFDPVSGPVQFQFLRARDASFTDELTYSGWSFSNSYTYGPVPFQVHGQIYYYKVQTRDVCLNTTSFSPEVWTIQDRWPPVSLGYTDNIPENNDPDHVYTRDRNVSFAPIDLYDDMSGNSDVFLQLSPNPAFTIITNAGWVGLATTTQNVAVADYANGVTVYARARYRDIAGNVSTWTVSDGIKIDTSDPVVFTVTLPGPFTATTTSLLTTWTSSSDAQSGIHHYEFALGTTSGATDTIPWTDVGTVLSTTTTGLALVHAQTYWASVKAVSGSRRERTANAAITCDIVAPPVPVMVALPTYTQGLSRLVQCGPVIDPVSGMETYRFWRADDASFTTGLVNSGWSSLTSFTFAGLTHAQKYYYRVEAQDRVFNICSFSADVSSIQDDVAPTATSFTDNVPENNDPDWVYTRDKTISFTPVSLTDPVSGVSDVRVQISRNNFVSMLSDTWVGVSGSTTQTIAAIADGNTIKARALYRDNVGNDSAWQTTDGIIVDLSPPVVGVISLPGSYTATTTSLVATWPASTDAQSGIHHYEFAMGTASGGTDIASWTDVGSATAYTATGLSLLDAQTYYVSVKTVNAARWETVTNRIITIDTTPPPVPTMSPLPVYTKGLTRTASCSTEVDPVSGGVTYRFWCATDASFTTGVASTSWLATTTTSFSGLVHGQKYFYCVEARDLVFNVCSFSPEIFSTQDNVGPTAASFTDDVPENNDPDGIYTRDKTVSFAPVSLTDPVSGVGDVQVVVSNTATFAVLLFNQMVGPAGSLTVTLPSLVDGEMIYALAIYYDVASNISAQVTDGIRLDLSPPSAVAISLPGVFTATTTEILATWTASTDAQSGIHHYEFAMGTASGGTDVVAWTDVGSATACTATGLTLLSSTTYYVSVKSVNGARWETIDTAAIVVDTDPPPVPTMSPLPAYTQGLIRTASCTTVADPLSGGVTYRFWCATNATFTTGLASTSWTTDTNATFSGLVHGQIYYYRVEARDVFSNTCAFSPVVFSTQDDTPPTVTSYSDNVAGNNDPDSLYSRDKTVSFGPIALIDDVSGVADVFIQVATDPAFASGSLLHQGSIGPAGTFTINLPSVADEDYLYARVQLTDVVGNLSPGWYTTDGIRIDLTPPVPVSIAINGGDAYTGTTTVSLALSATDLNGVSFMSLSNNGTVWTASEAYAITRSYTLPVGDGLKTVYVKFQDAAGNLSAPILASITLDTAVPVGSLAITEAPYTGTTTIHLSLVATSVAPISSMTIQIDGGAATTVPYITSMIWELPNAEATHTVEVSFKDQLGKRSASCPATICVDRIDPTLPTVIDDGLYSGSSTALHAIWLATDTSSDIERYVVGIGLAPGSDETASFTDLGPLTTQTFTGLSLNAGGPTLYYFTVRAYDHVGRFTEGYSDGIHGRDPSPPTAVTITTEGAFTPTSTVLLASWTASNDPESGIDHYEIGIGTASGTTNTVSWTNVGMATSHIASGLTLLDGQSYWISVKVVNGAMMQQVTTALPIKVDISPPPTPVMTVLPAFSPGTSCLVSCNAVTDAYSGGVQYRFQTASDAAFTLGLGDSGWISASSTTFAGLSHAQTYYYRVQARDAVLNATVFSASVFSKQDSNAPTVATYTDNVAGNNDPDSHYSRDKTVSFAPVGLADDLSGVANVYMKVATDPACPPASWIFQGFIGAAGTYTIALPTAADGDYVYGCVQLSDVAGNTSGWYQTDGIRIDQTPPGPVSMTIDGGTGYTATTAVTLDLSATDLNGVPLMSFSTNGTVWTASEAYSTSRPWTLSVGDGLKNVYVKFQDPAGNISAAILASITLDTAVPVGSFTIVEAPYVGTTTIHLSLIATSVAPISSMTIRIDGGIGTTVPYLTSIAWDLPSDATHTVEVSFRDQLGKKTASSSAMICVDRYDPTIPTVIDDGLYSGSPTTLHATWVATDTSSDILRYVVGIGPATGSDETASFTDMGLVTDNTFASLTLDMGGATMYYFTVRAYDHFGRFSIGYSDGIHGGDPTPPTPVVVTTDGAFSASSTILHASWSFSSDPESGVHHYEFAAGTSSGATDIVSWTNVGGATSYTATGLTLVDGQPYWISVKAVNGGMTGMVTTASPITIDISPPAQPVMTPLPASGFSSGTACLVSCNTVTDAYSGGVEYRFQTASDAAFTLGLSDSGWISGTSTTFSGLSHAQTYYYRVQSRDAVLNTSLFSAAVFSRQDANPPTATSFSDNWPADNNDPDQEFSRDSTVTFAPASLTDDLSTVKDVFVQVATEPSFANPLFGVWVGASGKLTQAYPTLPDGEKIYARAQFEDVAGNISGWMQTDGITLDFSDPVAGATTDNVFGNNPDYTVSPDADLYFGFTPSDVVSGIADVHIQIASDAVFSAPNIATDVWLGAPLTNYHFSLGQDGSTYYARIEARDKAGRLSGWGAPTDGIRVDLSPPTSTGPAFAINGEISTTSSELTTATTSAFLRLLVTDPSGVASASISNDGITWTLFGNPALSPASIPWTLDSTPGLKTIYVRFTDGVGHVTPLPGFTQTISYFPQNASISGSRNSKVYPVNTYDEYPGQNKYGGGFNATEGRALRLKKP